MVIVQEIIHSMRTSSVKKGMMAIKVDLEKAYDSVRWDFLQETLELTGLQEDLIRLIMQCVSTTRMSILWGGEISESFTPTRGLRQGDPLSPYLFMLYMERLAHIINDVVKDGS